MRFFHLLVLFAILGTAGATAQTPPQNAAAPAEYAYLVVRTNHGISEVRQYAVSASGALAPLKPAAVPAEHGAFNLTTDQSGLPLAKQGAAHTAYVANRRDMTVSLFAVGPGGMLAPLSPSPLPMGRPVEWVFPDPAHQVVYGYARGDILLRYAMSTNGALSPLPPLRVPGAQVVYIMPCPRAGLLFILYVLKAEYHSDQDYIVHADGYRTAGMEMPTRVSSRTIPGDSNLMFDPAGRFAYVDLPYQDAIACFRVGTDGALIEAGQVSLPTGHDASGMNFTRDGRYVYVVHEDAQHHNHLTPCRVENDGTLSVLSPGDVATQGDLVNITLDPSGRFLYTTAVHSGYTLNRFVQAYRIQADGTLEAVGRRVETGPNASLPGFDPAGRFAYISFSVSGASSTGRGDIMQFRVGPDGSLAPLSPPRLHVDGFFNHLVFARH